MTAERDSQDFDFLMENARAGRAMGISHFVHLDQPLGIWNYIRIANEIAAAIPAGRLLDWGCGLGQMSWLLSRRGFDVVSFDVAATVESLPELPLTRSVSIVRATHPTDLPFDAGFFDAVLSCGVLEHVDEYSRPGDEMLSLREIHRVLRPGGWFPIYQLPQRWAWQEALMRRLKRGYTHPRRFSETEIRGMLQQIGFDPVAVKRFNMLPKNLTGVPAAIRDRIASHARGALATDAMLSAIPLLNRIAGVLEVLARKR